MLFRTKRFEIETTPGGLYLRAPFLGAAFIGPVCDNGWYTRDSPAKLAGVTAPCSRATGKG